MSFDSLPIHTLAAHTVRILAAEAVQKANSGHPGMPMGMADAAVTLWTRFLRHDPAAPRWPDRDRFVLSAGHGSMLLYSLLHLTGYDLPMEQLQRFRQWGSLTPGHPEVGLTPGVETTTGPLGQGLSNGVGMALAERWLAQRFNRPGFDVVDHRTFVIASDGDLMEGVTHEACALAGHLGLGKLVVLYDDNGISIDGSTALSFGEDVLARFAGYGWQVARVDGHDAEAVAAAIAAAGTDPARPALIACRTTIGFGSPGRQGTSKAHGEPLGAEELAKTKAALGWPAEPAFHVPAEVAAFMRGSADRGRAAREAWTVLFARYRDAHPDLAAAFEEAMRGELPAGWEAVVPAFPPDKPMATRAASGAVLAKLVPAVPALLGGSADLTPSNNTFVPGTAPLRRDDMSGRYVHFGVREHGMGSVMNGLALHGGVRPYGGTFMVFSDYMRGAVRMAAIMDLPVTFVFTHDSIGLGEDGPTHQPIEHVASLRLIPNLWVIRPADANETAVAWRMALARTHGPTALALTRQPLPVLDPARYPTGDAARGGYVLVGDADPQVLLLSSGSEVHVALAARAMLAHEGIRTRVVSMPCTEAFDAQPAEYREAVLPPGVRARVGVEAGVTAGLSKYVGLDGEMVGLDRFGASAPYQTLYTELGITPEEVARAAGRVVAGRH
jgi:transketolase